jgi:hypothetical protein
MSVRGPARRRRLRTNLEDDPFALLVNFFDCAIVFALGFMIALLARQPSGAAATAGPGERPGAEVPGGAVRERFRIAHEKAKGAGERLGIAYRLPSGDVVYVPDGGAAAR